MNPFIAVPMHVYQRYRLLIVGVGLLVGACKPVSPNAPDPAPAQTTSRLLVRRVTARYGAPLTAATALALEYQGRGFYFLTRQEEIFQYDPENRLTLAQSWNPDRPDYSYEWSKYSYAYANGSMIFTNHNISPLYQRTYPLNAQGYIAELNTYNADNYVIIRREGPEATITQAISGGNIVKQVYQNSYSRRTTTYSYDVSKPGIPDPNTISWGRASRNLLTRQTVVMESFTGVAPVMPDQHVTTYAYVFDERGLAIQQTAHTESTLLSDPTISDQYLSISTLTYK